MEALFEGLIIDVAKLVQKVANLFYFFVGV